MTRREKKKAITLLVLTLLVFASFIAVMIWQSHRVELGEKGNIGKGNVVETIQQEYDDVYYVRTTYKNQQFRVLFDSVQRDDSHLVRYTPFDDKDKDDLVDMDIYGLDVPVNMIIEEWLTPEDYEKKINGYELFEASEDVTTIVLTKYTQPKYEVPTTFGWAVTYVTAPDSVSVDEQVQGFASEILDENGLGVDSYLLDQESDELSQYIKDNNFKLYNKTK